MLSRLRRRALLHRTVYRPSLYYLWGSSPPGCMGHSSSWSRSRWWRSCIRHHAESHKVVDCSHVGSQELSTASLQQRTHSHVILLPSVHPDFGLWTPGSGRWSGSSPKFIRLVLGRAWPCPTPSRNFVEIRSQLFQLCDGQTNRPEEVMNWGPIFKRS